MIEHSICYDERKSEMDKKEKISVSGVPETMLQTMYARAKESEKEHPYIYDKAAVEIVLRLDYDFSNADKDIMMSSGVIARTILLDGMVEEFLSSHPGTIVVNIACGMDTRCYRVKGQYKYWYNIDLPETIEIRNRFLKEDGPVFQIAKSATDASYTEEICYHDEPVLVVVEGLTMYLQEEDVKQIFHIVYEKFEKATVFVETMSPFVSAHVKEKSIQGSQAKFTWGVKNGKELQKLIPEFTNQKDVSLTEGMKVFSPAYKVLGKIPFIRNLSNKILVMEKKNMPGN